MIKQRVLTGVVALLCALPAAWLLADLRHVNPFLVFGTSIARTGEWSLRFLLCTLACTPLQRITSWSWPRALRRTFGLAAFAYALAHTLVYLHVGQHWNWAFVIDDFVRRVSRPPGWLAFLLLVPLALTSTTALVRKLGGRRWKALHRLVYVVMLLSVTHLALVDHENSDVYARTQVTVVACACIIVARLVAYWRTNSRRARATDERARR